MDKKSRSKSGIRIRDEHPGSISESLETIIWVENILKKFYVDPDPETGIFFPPGSGMEKIRIRDKHPGSATLPLSGLPGDYGDGSSSKNLGLW